MQDIAIYFTPDEHENYRRGHLAVGFTQEERDKLRVLEKLGVDCELSDSPLSEMTKVRPICVSGIEWAEFGKYVSRPCRLH